MATIAKNQSIKSNKTKVLGKCFHILEVYMWPVTRKPIYSELNAFFKECWFKIWLLCIYQFSFSWWLIFGTYFATSRASYIDLNSTFEALPFRNNNQTTKEGFNYSYFLGAAFEFEMSFNPLLFNSCINNHEGGPPEIKANMQCDIISW